MLLPFTSVKLLSFFRQRRLFLLLVTLLLAPFSYCFSSFSFLNSSSVVAISFYFVFAEFNCLVPYFKSEHSACFHQIFAHLPFFVSKVCYLRDLLSQLLSKVCLLMVLAFA